VLMGFVGRSFFLHSSAVLSWIYASVYLPPAIRFLLFAAC
jgi:hypothetical protein